MKQIISFIIIIWASFASAQTMDELFVSAAKNRPEIRAIYHEFEAEIERITAVTGFPNPNLSMGYFLSPIETRVGPQRFRVSLSQRIPWWGELKASERVQKAKAEVAYQRYLWAINQLYIEVVTSYSKYYEWEKTYLNTLSEQDLRRQSLALKRQQYTEGKASLSDITRAEMALEDIVRLTQKMKDEFDVIILEIQTVIGDSIEPKLPNSLNLPDNLSIPSKKTQNAFTEVFQKQNQVISQRMSLTQKKRIPQLNLGIDYMAIENTNLPTTEAGKDALMPMIGISLPIFNQNVTAELNALEKESQVNSLRKNEAIAQSNLVVLETVTSYNNKMKDITFYALQLEKTDLLLELLNNEYRVGEATYFEIIELQQQRLSYSNAMAKTEADAFMLYARYLVYTGELQTDHIAANQPQ
jgi:outer membrane protein TolC